MGLGVVGGRGTAAQPRAPLTLSRRSKRTYFVRKRREEKRKAGRRSSGNIGADASTAPKGATELLRRRRKEARIIARARPLRLGVPGGKAGLACRLGDRADSLRGGGALLLWPALGHAGRRRWLYRGSLQCAGINIARRATRHAGCSSNNSGRSRSRSSVGRRKKSARAISREPTLAECVPSGRCVPCKQSRTLVATCCPDIFALIYPLGWRASLSRPLFRPKCAPTACIAEPTDFAPLEFASKIDHSPLLPPPPPPPPPPAARSRLATGPAPRHVPPLARYTLRVIAFHPVQNRHILRALIRRQ